MTTLAVTESLDLKEVFSKFPTGVAAISAMVNGVPKGLVASSFTVGVSMDPPLVSFSAQHTSTTWPVLRNAERIGVSILGSEQQETCLRMASRKPDKFDDILYRINDHGAIIVPGCSLWLECSVFAELPAGDHSVILLKVESAQAYPDKSPIVLHESLFKFLEGPLAI